MEAERLALLVDEYFERSLELNPLRATALGDHRWDDQFPNNIGPEHRAQTEDLDQEYLDQIDGINPELLLEQDLITWQIFKSQRENAIEGFQYPAWLMPFDQFLSTPNYFAQLGGGDNIHPFETAKNYDDFLGRIAGFAVWADQAIENMRQGIAQDYVKPRVLMEKALPQLGAHVGDDVTNSLFYRPIMNFPDGIGPEDRERLTALYTRAIEGTIVPTYRRLYRFVRDEYIPAARDSVGMDALPNGTAWYAYLVRMMTTTERTPDEIHQIGLDEVARIQAEMRQVMDQVGFDGDLQGFVEFLKTDPRFYFTEREDLIAGYRALRRRVQEMVPGLFARFPQADYEIRAVAPFREQSEAAGSYQSPAPDGSRPGIFYVNAYDLSSRPQWGMESLFLHEGVPGHHFQIALQQEVDSLPRFRRFGGYTAYTEGWGLYAETLGRELGVYTDPYQYFGFLNAELWRAVRLVVDTGLHAKGWSRQEVLNYMSRNTALGDADVVAETERYIAIPGQALAYKTGQLKIRELRNRAGAALDESFDPRSFHEAILIDGSLPLDILDAKIDRWIATQAN